MNEQTTKAATILVNSGETLDLCRQLRELRREGRKATEDLNERYRAEADAMNAAFERRNNELWAKLYEQTGIDPDGDWTVDTEYLDDHGVAFIKPDEQRHQHGGMPAALAALLGGQVEMIEEEPEPAPTLN